MSGATLCCQSPPPMPTAALSDHAPRPLHALTVAPPTICLIQDRPPNPCSQAGYARITTGISVFVLVLLILKSIHEGPAKVCSRPPPGACHTPASAHAALHDARRLTPTRRACRSASDHPMVPCCSSPSACCCSSAASASSARQKRPRADAPRRSPAPAWPCLEALHAARAGLSVHHAITPKCDGTLFHAATNPQSAASHAEPRPPRPPATQAYPSMPPDMARHVPPRLSRSSRRAHSRCTSELRALGLRTCPRRGPRTKQSTTLACDRTTRLVSRTMTRSSSSTATSTTTPSPAISSTISTRRSATLMWCDCEPLAEAPPSLALRTFL